MRNLERGVSPRLFGNSVAAVWGKPEEAVGKCGIVGYSQDAKRAKCVFGMSCNVAYNESYYSFEAGKLPIR